MKTIKEFKQNPLCRIIEVFYYVCIVISIIVLFIIMAESEVITKTVKFQDGSKVVFQEKPTKKDIYDVWHYGWTKTDYDHLWVEWYYMNKEEKLLELSQKERLELIKIHKRGSFDKEQKGIIPDYKIYTTGIWRWIGECIKYGGLIFIIFEGIKRIFYYIVFGTIRPRKQ